MYLGYAYKSKEGLWSYCHLPLIHHWSVIKNELGQQIQLFLNMDFIIKQMMRITRSYPTDRDADVPPSWYGMETTMRRTIWLVDTAAPRLLQASILPVSSWPSGSLSTNQRRPISQYSTLHLTMVGYKSNLYKLDSTSISFLQFLNVPKLFVNTLRHF